MMDLTLPLNNRPPDPRGACVLYWMQNAQRPDGNPALNEAIRRANAAGLPVAVFVGLDAAYPMANARSWSFLLDGLRETEAALEEAGIAFVLRPVPPGEGVVDLARETRAREVIVDSTALRTLRAWRTAAADALDIPLTEVAADTLVPHRAFGRLAATARILRPFLHDMLPDVDWDQRRPRVTHPHPPFTGQRIRLADTPTEDLLDRLGADRSVPPVRGIPPGPAAARKVLSDFVEYRLHRYDAGRNRAERDATSGLSPYLHFGQVGPHEVARAVMDADAPETDSQAFLEQLTVRRELSWNLCAFNPDYDRYEGLPHWGLASLEKHTADPRPVLYTREQMEAAQTHDDVWNAAQREMVTTGRMHNYLRMLWAKKILEWSPTPREAFDTAVYLNDRYLLDGRDPNSYAGICLAIGGRHDRPWPERPIFGVIRYMSSASTRRKMDIPAYIQRVEESAASEDAE